MVLPPRLRAGDRVAVCAPAGPVTRPERFRAGLAVLEERYRVVCDPELFAQTGYLAGSDERRADELNRYLRDADVRAIFLARGGYGLMRILGRLDDAALRDDPVPIVGFSDATALLAWARARAGVASVHGPVVAQLGKLGRDDVAWLVRLLEDPRPPGDLGWQLESVGEPLPKPHRGALVGGNLCLLSHLAGTPYQVDTERAIVYLEEVGEPPYRLDRYLTHLQLSGALAGAGAVIAGDFCGCDEPADGYAGAPSPVGVVDERLLAMGLPGLCGAPFGHGDRHAALPFGTAAALEDGRLLLEEAAVS